MCSLYVTSQYDDDDDDDKMEMPLEEEVDNGSTTDEATNSIPVPRLHRFESMEADRYASGPDGMPSDFTCKN